MGPKNTGPSIQKKKKKKPEKFQAKQENKNHETKTPSTLKKKNFETIFRPTEKPI